MDTSAKIAALQRLLDLAAEIKVHDSDDPEFKTWKNTVERTLIRVYGQPSPEVEQFNKLRFFYQAIIMALGEDYSHEHRRCFDRDFQILTSSIRSYVDELEQSAPTVPAIDAPALVEPRIARVFISHASADAPLVRSSSICSRSSASNTNRSSVVPSPVMESTWATTFWMPSRRNF